MRCTFLSVMTFGTTVGCTDKGSGSGTIDSDSTVMDDVSGVWTGLCTGNVPFPTTTTTGYYAMHLEFDSTLDLIEQPPGTVAGTWSATGVAATVTTSGTTSTSTIGMIHGQLVGTHAADLVELELVKGTNSTGATYPMPAGGVVFALTQAGDDLTGALTLAGPQAGVLDCALAR